MGTIGNLELRIGRERSIASTAYDGYMCYRAIGKLADFLEEHKEPTFKQWTVWFYTMSSSLFSQPHYIRELLGGVPCEVIIDVDRKLVLHNADVDGNIEREEISDLIRKKVFRKLKDKDYQVIHFKKPKVLALLNSEAKKLK